MTSTIHTGNVLDILPTLPANSVQCCVTSPPYWGLRDYGTATWEGGDAGCDHRKVLDAVAAVATSTLGGGKETTGHLQEGYKHTCARCGARRIDAQLGLEPTPQEYVANMVRVFAEVRRVLRDDGTLWLNIGDSYYSDTATQGRNETKSTRLVSGWTGEKVGSSSYRRSDSTLKPKDLCGIPWRVAFALQEDGWWLRSEITWCKKAPMPESCTDRPTSATEKIFLLTKRANYFYDAQAVAETSDAPIRSRPFSDGCGGRAQAMGREPTGNEKPGAVWTDTGTRNQRNFWLLGPEPYSEAHFATFPTEIPRRAILAGTSAHGACAQCGAPWQRVVEKSGGTIGNGWTDHTADLTKGMAQISQRVGSAKDANGKPYTVETLGFAPTCTCGCTETVPCVVLDPFLGSGTSGAVARTLGRSFIGCELNPAYVELAERRIGAAQPALFGL